MNTQKIENTAGLAKANYHLNQLKKILQRATDRELLQMIWALDALISGRQEAAKPLLAIPRTASDQSIGSPHAVHKWELETLVIQLLLSSGQQQAAEGGVQFDCAKFESAAFLVNRLRQLESSEGAVYLNNQDFNVFGELHRVGQRQFHWQRGYHNLPQFYRSAFIYGQGKCAEYFEKEHELPIVELNFVAFALFAQSMTTPWLNHELKLPELGLTTELLESALPLLLLSRERARGETKAMIDNITEKHGRPIPTAFLPSVLRRYPLISVNDKEFIAPIPEVLLIRVTSGLYYDLIKGGQALLNEANDRFEEYCAAYIEATMKRFKLSRAYLYEPRKGASVATPDVLVKDGEKLTLAIECKATKLTYLAQFAEDPFEAEKNQYLQIANGVFQLWRFFSHVRRGLLKEAADANTAAMVLTHDSFLMMGPKLKAKIIEEATVLADKEGEITQEDRRAIIFCPIQDLEGVLSLATEDIFLETLRAATQDKYSGWELSSVHREERRGKEKIEQKKFPFVLDKLLPWWDRVEEYKRQAKEKAKV